MVNNPKNRVNGCTLDKAGKVIRVYYEGNLYLDTKTGIVSNRYRKKAVCSLDSSAIKREIRRAKYWRLAWDRCSAT